MPKPTAWRRRKKKCSFIHVSIQKFILQYVLVNEEKSIRIPMKMKTKTFFFFSLFVLLLLLFLFYDFVFCCVLPSFKQCNVGNALRCQEVVTQVFLFFSIFFLVLLCKTFWWHSITQFYDDDGVRDIKKNYKFLWRKEHFCVIVY